MITVAEAERIIQSRIKNYGVEDWPLNKALGRVLAADIRADRDLPPFNRVTMDGIAIKYEAFEKGIRSFHIKGIQAAGEAPQNITTLHECIEIMTGSALPETTDTVLRYEDVLIENGIAEVNVYEIKKGQNIHRQGTDKKKGAVLAAAGQEITPTVISAAASVGATRLIIKKFPTLMIIPTGDELIDVHQQPSVYQIRQSNNYTLQAALKEHGISADTLHLPDDVTIIKNELQRCLQTYDVLLLSGGISMGKFDYVPRVLNELSVETLFRKVQQRPGKPFWFGEATNGVLVFAFPGNPVSALLCLYRYFFPWLQASLGVKTKTYYAALSQDFQFKPALQYFLQVTLEVNEKAQWIATPIEGNGSGDFANLIAADGFLELPAERDTFRQGDVFRVWPFKNLN